MGELIGIQATRAALVLGEGWRVRREWCVTAQPGTTVLADPLVFDGCAVGYCRTLIYVPDGDSQVGWAENPAILCWDDARRRWHNALSYGKDGTAVLSVVPVWEGDPPELVRFEARLQLAGAAETVVEVYRDVDDTVAACPQHLFFDWPPGSVLTDYPEAGQAVLLSGVLGEAGVPGPHLPPLLNLYLEAPDCAGASYELCLSLYWLTPDDRDTRGGWYGAFWWEGACVRLFVDRDGSTGACCPLGVMDPAGTLLGDRGQFDLHFLVYVRANEVRYAVEGDHTWTCPGGVASVVVEAVGGGGCGGAGDGVSRPGGGGGGGGYAVRYAIPVTPAGGYTAHVGKAPAYTDPGGRDGEDSTFTGDGGASVTGGGGRRGQDDAEGGAGGAGGTGAGDYTFDGWPGHPGMVDGAADGAGGAAGGPAQSSYGHGGRGRVAADGTGTQGRAGQVTVSWGGYTVTDTAVAVQCIDPTSNTGHPGPEAFRYAPQEKVYDYYGNASYAALDLGSFWDLGFACPEGASPPVSEWGFQVGSWWTVFAMPGEDMPCNVGKYPRVKVLTVAAGGGGVTAGYDGEHQQVGFRLWPGGGDEVLHGEAQFTNQISCCDYLPLGMTALAPLPMPRTLRCHCHATGNIATGEVTYLWIEQEEAGTWDGAAATWVFDYTAPEDQRQYARDFGHMGDAWEKAMWERVRVTLTWSQADGWDVALHWWGWGNDFLSHHEEEAGTLTGLSLAEWPFSVSFVWQAMGFTIDNQAFAHRETPITAVTVQFAELCAPPEVYVGGAWRDGACVCDVAPTYCAACADGGLAWSHYHTTWNGVLVRFAWSEKCIYLGEYDLIPGGAGGAGLRLRLFAGPAGAQYAGIFPVTGAGAGDPLYASTAEDFAAWTCGTDLTLHRQYASGADPDTLTLTPGIG